MHPIKLHLPRHAGTLAVALASALAAFTLVGFTPLATAQTAQYGQQAAQVDPPGRVARLSDLSGSVWFYGPDATEWTNASRNRPLTTGDWLATDADSRAELQIGSTTVRLAAGSELEVRQLDDQRVSLQLHKGSAWARLRNGRAVAEFEMLTDEGRFHAQRAGRYRFDRTGTSSQLAVYAGQAMYEGPSNALTVEAGQRAEFWIEPDSAAQYSIGDLQSDEFSAWNDDRDRDRELAPRAISNRYVSPEMTGAEDLDRYGRWEQSPDYGALWIPRGVAAGWAPYSTGHWAWVRPWGWTWVDDAPWGFAPFHYGRWVWARNNWCWAPGERVLRPIYAPALVAWVGGPHLSLSISLGGDAGPAVGWFPLAPREVYVPSYRTSPYYAQNINVTNVTNITNITTIINNPQAPRDFRNRHIPNAVTVVPASVVTSREAVAPAAARMRATPVHQQQVAILPVRGPALVVAPVAAPVSTLALAATPALHGNADARPVRPPASPVAAVVAPTVTSLRPPAATTTPAAPAALVAATPIPSARPAPAASVPALPAPQPARPAPPVARPGAVVPPPPPLRAGTEPARPTAHPGAALPVPARTAVATVPAREPVPVPAPVVARPAPSVAPPAPVAAVRPPPPPTRAVTPSPAPVELRAPPVAARTVPQRDSGDRGGGIDRGARRDLPVPAEERRMPPPVPHATPAPPRPVEAQRPVEGSRPVVVDDRKQKVQPVRARLDSERDRRESPPDHSQQK